MSTSSFTIYAITERTTGKNYVGVTHDYDARIRKHFRMLKAGNHVNRHLRGAYARSGPEGLDARIVATVQTVEEARSFELLLLNYIALDPLAMNINKGRNGQLPSEETRRKISDALKGRQFTEEHRRKLSKKNEGRHYSTETRAKLSIAMRERQAARKKAA